MSDTTFLSMSHVVLDNLDQSSPRVQKVRECVERIEETIQLSPMLTWDEEEALYNLCIQLVTLAAAAPYQNMQMRHMLHEQREFVEAALVRLPYTQYIVFSIMLEVLELVN